MATRTWGYGNYDELWGGYAPRPNAAQRAQKAAKELAKLAKKGVTTQPVVIEGRKIASTFWGKAWCENLEGYSDFSNRLPRGRTYVRSGSVVDLQIAPGKVTARVQGSRLYSVTIDVGAAEPDRWKKIAAACAGKIDSVIELLQGRLSTAVMEVITDRTTGLFPSPKHLHFACSCPDYASMCKHVAASLYGVGARLDREPELLFRLRGVDAQELVATAAKGGSLGGRVAKEKQLGGDLESLFGIELDSEPAAEPASVASVARGSAKKETEIKENHVTVITGEELAYLGVPPATVQYWLKTGVLGRTGQRGVYEETAIARQRLEQRARTAGV